MLAGVSVVARVADTGAVLRDTLPLVLTPAHLPARCAPRALRTHYSKRTEEPVTFKEMLVLKFGLTLRAQVQ